MKTENLTWVEAGRAYFEGQKIQDSEGNKYWLQEGVPKRKHPSEHQEREETIFLGIKRSNTPFCIVVPEEKSLSFEEAAELPRVRITLPDYLNGGNYVMGEGNWDWSLLDLAERKKWKITEVKE